MSKENMISKSTKRPNLNLGPPKDKNSLPDHKTEEIESHPAQGGFFNYLPIPGTTGKLSLPASLTACTAKK